MAENPLSEDDANRLIKTILQLCTKYGCGPDDPFLPWMERRLKFAQIVGVDDEDAEPEAAEA